MSAIWSCQVWWFHVTIPIYFVLPQQNIKRRLKKKIQRKEREKTLIKASRHLWTVQDRTKRIHNSRNPAHHPGSANSAKYKNNLVVSVAYQVRGGGMLKGIPPTGRGRSRPAARRDNQWRPGCTTERVCLEGSATKAGLQLGSDQRKISGKKAN